MKFYIEPLFATPFVSVDLSEVVQDPANSLLQSEIKLLENLVSDNANCIKNQSGNYRSSSTKVLDNAPILENLLQQCVDKYSVSVLGEEPKLTITGSWLNRNDTGSFHHPHSHLNSIVSAVFYLQVPPDSGRFLVYAPAYRQNMIRDNIVENNQWNSDFYYYEPKQYQIYLFPSNTQHSVEANNNSCSRISLSFNTFYRTKIGSEAHELDITNLSKVFEV